MNKRSSTAKPSFEQWLAEQGAYYDSDIALPEWDREAPLRSAYRPQKRPSWWLQPLAFTSFALSCLAVSLVVVQDYRSDINATIDARVAELVEQKLTVFEEQQKIRRAQQGKT